MSKTQLIMFLTFAYLATVGGVVWMWGAVGLISSGAVSLVAGLAMKVKEGRS